MSIGDLLEGHAWICVAWSLYAVTLALYGLVLVRGAVDVGRRGIAGLASVLSDRNRWRRLALAGLALLAAAFLANTAILVDRWIEAGRPPFKTRFETFLLYPWCLTATTFVLIAFHRLHVVVPFVAAAAVAFLGVALSDPDLESVFLMPALQSGWFVPHVVMYFVSYSALLLSAVVALLCLLEPLWRNGMGRMRSRLMEAGWQEPSGSAGSGELVASAYKTAAFGVTTLTLGLVMGAVWAKFAWGDYWTWDPKENWSLITWLAYVAYLHLARMPGWQGRRSAWLLVASFGAVMFTWLGMHLLPTAEGSLHVYQ